MRQARLVSTDFGHRLICKMRHREEPVSKVTWQIGVRARTRSRVF